LLAQFGRPAAATGFALKTTRILDVARKEEPEQAGRTLVVYAREQRRDALLEAERLRADGLAVTTQAMDADSPEWPELRARAQRTESFVFRGVEYDSLLVYGVGKGEKA